MCAISLNLGEICRKHESAKVTCKMFVCNEFVVRALVIKSPIHANFRESLSQADSSAFAS